MLLSLLLVSGFAISQTAATSIEVSQEGKIITVTFNQDELNRVNGTPSYVVEKLNAAGVKCCGKKKRISDCIWVCCEGNKIRTCDPILIKALEQIWKD
jgi:hypothetical protein